MYLMILVINKKETVNNILEMFLKIGISGATLLESKGMGQKFMDCESPVVGGLRTLIYDQCRPGNNVIISVVDSLETYEHAVKEVEKITGSFNEPGTGLACAFPLARVNGLLNPKTQQQ